jgi:hypothetical protein
MSATIAYLRNHNYNGIEDIEKLKTDFYKAYITVSYDADLIDGKRRVIFTANKGMRSQKFDKITYECNGLVLEAPTWNPLCIPCPMPKTSVNNEIVNRLLNRGQYKIYKITDGTVVYLYYWGEWKISTARGIDMGNVVLNNKTYKSLLVDAAAKYVDSLAPEDRLITRTLSPVQNSEETESRIWDEFTAVLDKKVAYSFVIRHPDIHPFMTDGSRGLLFIQKTYVGDGQILFDRTAHGLPFAIPVQEELATEPKLRTIYSNLSSSLPSWLNTGKDPLFGYMLVSTAPYRAAGDHSCVLFESSLMRNIRQLVYDKKFMEYGTERLLATAVHAYLGNSRDIFIKLFPRYQSVYSALDSLQNRITSDILKYIEENGAPAQNEKDAIDMQKSSHVEFFAGIICKKITIDPTNAEANKHIYGVINNPKYTRLYIGLLTNAPVHVGTDIVDDNKVSNASKAESKPANDDDINSEFCEMIKEALKNKPELWT